MVHGDIRGTNILLDDNFQVKIADFGLARHSDGTGTKNEAMSAPFTAPELFLESDKLKRTKKTDVYAFGCLFYEVRALISPYFSELSLVLHHQIYFGCLPFVCNVYNIGRNVRSGQRPRRLDQPPLDERAWHLIERCWHMEPARRPSMDDVVQTMKFWYRSPDRSYPLSPPMSP